MPHYKVFIAYIGNDYGMKVARSVDQCLWRHHWVPRIELSYTHGEIQADDFHDVIKEEGRCDAVLAINSEGAINRRRRLKFWIEVSKALFEFYKPSVALIQARVPTLHHLNNPEVRHVKFPRGHHRQAWNEIMKELKGRIENSAVAPDRPLGEDLPRRRIHASA